MKTIKKNLLKNKKIVAKKQIKLPKKKIQDKKEISKKISKRSSKISKNKIILKKKIDNKKKIKKNINSNNLDIKVINNLDKIIKNDAKKEVDNYNNKNNNHNDKNENSRNNNNYDNDNKNVNKPSNRNYNNQYRYRNNNRRSNFRNYNNKNNNNRNINNFNRSSKNNNFKRYNNKDDNFQTNDFRNNNFVKNRYTDFKRKNVLIKNSVDSVDNNSNSNNNNYNKSNSYRSNSFSHNKRINYNNNNYNRSNNSNYNRSNNNNNYNNQYRYRNNNRRSNFRNYNNINNNNYNNQDRYNKINYNNNSRYNNRKFFNNKPFKNNIINRNISLPIINNLCYDKILVEDDKLYLVFLGGVTEIGRSCCALIYNKEIIIVDSGIKYINNSSLNHIAKFSIPDFDFIIKNKEFVKAIYFTHGHEDHIGSLNYLIKLIDKKIPIYGGKITIAFIKRNFAKFNYKIDDYQFIELKPSKHYKISKYIEVIPFHVNHSIPNAFTTRIIFNKTYSIIHSGDFKIDLESKNKYDFKNIILYNYKTTDIMLSECTNANKEGFSLSENSVKKTFEKIFSEHRGRIFIGIFSSHIQRIINLVQLCVKFNKRIFALGFSIKQNIEIASKLDFLNIPRNVIAQVSIMYKFNNDNIVVLCAGTQGITNGSSYKIIFNKYKYKNIELSKYKNDLFIFSSTIIPGNDKAVLLMINELLSKDIKVIYKHNLNNIHASGHAYKKEFQLFLSFVEPKYLMLIHGEPIHTYYQKQNAIDLHTNKDNIFRPTLGSVWCLDKKILKQMPSFPYREIYLDGNGSILTEEQLKESLSCVNGICLINKSINNKKILIKYYGKISSLLDNDTKKKIETLVADKILNNETINIKIIMSKFLLNYIQIENLPLIILI